MTLSSALLLFLLLIGASLVSLRYYQQLQLHKEMARGTGFIICLEKLLVHLPQHRGMANAFLNGDESFLEKVKSMQSAIADDITKIEHYLEQQALPDNIKSNWRHISEGWNKLLHEISGLSPNESFEQHTLLIGKILYLISDTADETHVSNHPDDTLGQIINTTFNLFPPIIEVIGQARGIGTGAAAKGTLITAVRIKLEFLHQRLDSTTKSAYATIESCLNQNSNGKCRIDPQLLNTARAHSEHFLTTTSTKLLGDQICINANDYFGEGSRTFDSNISLFKAITTGIDNMLNNHIPVLRRNFILSVVAMFVVLALLGPLWWQSNLG